MAARRLLTGALLLAALCVDVREAAVEEGEPVALETALPDPTV